MLHVQTDVFYNNASVKERNIKSEKKNVPV